METRHEIASKYGYKLRSALDADFLSEVDRTDPRRTKDDLMKIASNGEITLYAPDAQAYFVATLIRNTPR